MDIIQMRGLLANGGSIYTLPLRVVDYSRVSTDFYEQESSLKNQQTYYKALIDKTSSWTYAGSYVDDGISGTRTAGRNDFNKMIEDGMAGKFDLIITKEVPRFARNTLDSIYYTRELLKKGVAVYFETDNINTLYEDSEFKLTLMASLAQEESRKTSMRVKWAKRKLVEDGVISIPPNMHGYVMKDGVVSVVEEEAIMVREVFELYIKGLGFRRIGDELAKMGYRNSNNNVYGYSTLHTILTNPRYKGFFTGGMTEKVSFLSTKITHKDQSEWVMYPAPDIIPPIVSEEVWDKANEILKEKSEKASLVHSTSYQNKYKYSGKIYCKAHDATYHRTVYRYKVAEDRELYQCKVYREKGKSACNSPLLYAKEIDAILSCIFKAIFRDKEKFIGTLLNIIEKNLEVKNYKSDISRITKEIEKTKDRKDKLLDLIMSDLISKDEFKKRNTDFNVSLEKLDEELNKYKELDTSRKNTANQLDKMRDYLGRNYDFDNELPEELVDAFVEKIYVEAGEIENLVKLNISLKTGQEIPTYYRKDLSLSLATHIDSDKMMFKLPRVKYNMEAPDLEVLIEDITLKIAI